MKIKNVVCTAILAALALSLSSCKLDDAAGTYTGFVVVVKNQKSQHESVTFTITKSGMRDLQVDVSQSRILGARQLTVHVQSKSEMTINSDFLPVPSLDLQGQANSDCLSSADKAVSLCMTETTFSLEARYADVSYEISASKNGQGIEMPVSPVPTRQIDFPVKNYTVEELRDLNAQRSYDNLAEAEAVFQARKTGEAAYKYLAPHITVFDMTTAASTAITGITGISLITGMLSVLTDVAPFLFPSNWIRADESTILGVAEAETQSLLLNDSSFSVEVLADAIIRDGELLTIYDDSIKEITQLYKEIRVLEDRGDYKTGDSLYVKTVLDNIIIERLDLQLSYVEQKENLANIIGSANPDIIQNITWANEKNPVDAPFSVSYNDYYAQGFKYSVEKCQANTLVDLSRDQKKEANWAWLDPSGAQFTGFSAAYPDMIQVSQSKVNQTMVMKNKAISTLNTTLEKAFKDYEESLIEYPATQTLVKDNMDHLHTILASYHTGSSIDLVGFKDVLTDTLQAQVALKGIIATYRSNRAHLQRLMYNDFYSKYKSEKQCAKYYDLN